jgi:hypothetical protein
MDMDLGVVRLFASKYYDPFFGDVVKKLNTLWEDVKPEYLSSMLYSGVKWPNHCDSALVFPAAIMFDASYYVRIPEVVAREYFSEDIAEFFAKWWRMREQGLAIPGYDMWVWEPPSAVLNFTVEKIEDDIYRVEFNKLWDDEEIIEDLSFKMEGRKIVAMAVGNSGWFVPSEKHMAESEEGWMSWRPRVIEVLNA